MTGFIIGLVLGLVIASPLFAYLGYRYGSKAVSAGVTLSADLQKVESEVKKL